MTEAEWLACEEPRPMVAFVGSRASERKLRLFAVACGEQVKPYLPAREWSLRALETAEKYVEGFASSDDLDAAQANVESRLELYGGEPVYDAGYWACAREMVEGASGCAFYAANFFAIMTFDKADEPDSDEKWETRRAVASRFQCNLLRDIFGNPFRPVAFDPAWRTTDVMLLAQGIYDERAFDRMPILADTLQDAGCDSDDILNHCRDNALTHVRGCWVVDLVLGKS